MGLGTNLTQRTFSSSFQPSSPHRRSISLRYRLSRLLSLSRQHYCSLSCSLVQAVFSSCPGHGCYFRFSSHVSPFFLFLIISSSRIFFIPHLQERWKGSVPLSLFIDSPMVFVLLLFSVNNGYVPPQLAQLQLASRVRVLMVYESSIAIGFPINRLRNLGIALVETSHYLVTDMDMWPTRAIDGPQ